jgi:hypothetical protein
LARIEVSFNQSDAHIGSNFDAKSQITI